MKKFLLVLFLLSTVNLYAQEKLIFKSLKYTFLKWSVVEHRTIQIPWVLTDYNIVLNGDKLYIGDKNNTNVQLGKIAKESSDEKEKRVSWYAVDKNGFDCTVELKIIKGTHYGGISIDYVDLRSYMWIIDLNGQDIN